MNAQEKRTSVSRINLTRGFTVLLTLILLLALGGGLMMTRQAQAQALQNVESPQANLGTAFTYQGYLEYGSGPVDGTCDFKFSLWDASNGGAQKGSEQGITGVNVSNGYFSASLNNSGEFGGDAFQGDARYLQIKVKCSGDSDYVLMSGRVALNAAPYALSLMPGAVINGTSSGNILSVYNNGAQSSSTAILGSSPVGAGVTGVSASHSALYGLGGAPSGRTLSVAAGVWGDSSSGYGVYGTSDSDYGVYGINNSTSGAGVFGESHHASGVGVRGDTVNGHGVEGVVDWTSSGAGYGVYGYGGFYGYGGGFENVTADVPTVQIKNLNYTAGGPALHVYGTTVVTATVSGIGASGSGLYVHNISSSGVAHGIYGQTDASSGYGVYGQGPTIGVYGNGSTAGVYGEGSTSGVHGITSGAGAHGVYGQNFNSSSGYGVYGRGFRGVQGYTSSVSGVGGFFMDMNTTASGTSVGMWAGSYYG
ncbi:MAG: hypothetical protein KKD28_06525, partial [Chloroflexi bacterium]|nr:hypothetical protein [Chloroflexota bacterium]